MAYIGLKQLDPILTGSLQVSGSAGFTGSLSLRAGDKLFTEADEGTYLQSDSADRLRAVVGGSQMLLMDQDDGRVNIGYGQKLGVGLGNNTTPGVELEVDGDVSGSGLGSFGTVYAGTHITASGNISASGTIYASNFESAESWSTFDASANGVGDDPVGYSGGIFDGRYIYFAPFKDSNGQYHGEVLRYDTTFQE